MSDACSWPPGYKFDPTHEELVVHYLLNKVNNMPLPLNIPDVTLQLSSPDDLTSGHRPIGDRIWYFFTPTDRKYPKGKRPSRSAGNGFWKPTGADMKVYYQEKVVGLRKTLKFYQGDHLKSKATNWIMQEYRPAEEPPLPKPDSMDMRLNAWVLCKIYKHLNKSEKGRKTLDREREGDNISGVDVPARGLVPAVPEAVALAAAMDQFLPRVVNDTNNFGPQTTTRSLGGFTMTSSNQPGCSTSSDSNYLQLPRTCRREAVVPICSGPPAVNYIKFRPQATSDSSGGFTVMSSNGVSTRTVEDDTTFRPQTTSDSLEGCMVTRNSQNLHGGDSDLQLHQDFEVSGSDIDELISFDVYQDDNYNMLWPSLDQ